MPASPLDDCVLACDALPRVEAINIARVPADHDYLEHRVELHEFNFMSHGHYDISLNGQVMRTEPGWVYSYRPGDIARARSGPADGELVCSWIRFRWMPAAAGEPAHLPRACEFDPAEQMRWTEVFQRVLERHHAADPGWRLATSGGLLELIGIILAAEARRQSGGQRIDQRLRAALTFMEAHHRRQLSIPEIAAAAGMSEDYFSRVFRRQLGRPPLQSLIDMRLMSARRMLIHEPAVPINEVSSRCGFEDPGHFARLFRRRFGTPPRALRTRLAPR